MVNTRTQSQLIYMANTQICIANTQRQIISQMKLNDMHGQYIKSSKKSTDICGQCTKSSDMHGQYTKSAVSADMHGQYTKYACHG